MPETVPITVNKTELQLIVDALEILSPEAEEADVVRELLLSRLERMLSGARPRFEPTPKGEGDVII